jgi:HK97 family phage major capsid protein
MKEKIMDQKNLALMEDLITEFQRVEDRKKQGITVTKAEADRVNGVMNDSLCEFIENGGLEQVTADLNAGRHRAIRPDVSYNPHPAIAYRGGKKGEFFSSLGEQLQAVYRAGQPGQKPDDRLFRVSEAFEKRTASGLSEQIGADAGFMVESSFTTDLVKEIFETGQLAKLCYSLPITRGNSIKIPAFNETSRVTGSRLGGVRGYWIGEAADKPSSKPGFRNMELSLKKLVALIYGTEELIEDIPLLEAIVRKGVASEFGFQVDDAIINGTGVGCPLGVCSSGSLITVPRTTASTVAYQDLINLWCRLLPGSHRRSYFLINSDVLPQLLGMTYGAAGNNTPVYIPANSAANAPYDTLLGRPCIQAEQCQTMGTKGDILLGDFAEGYVLGEKPGGMQFASSIHVRFVNDEVCWRFVLRLDGQPTLSNAITPAHGTDKLGHFICLS